MEILDTSVVIITIASFFAAMINAAFATGGVYIMLAVSASVLPLSAAVPLQSPLAFGSLSGRIIHFWEHIKWKIVGPFAAGCSIGALIGTSIYVDLPEHIIAIFLGAMLLASVWGPSIKWTSSIKHPFFLVGIGHSFLGSILGVGTLLQPALLKTDLLKLQITSTLAASLLIMDFFKIIGYVNFGFDFFPYIPHIIGATLAGFLGTWVGKKITHRVSESAFRIVFKGLITIVACRLLYTGIVSFLQL